MPEVSDAVTVGGAYKESEDFTPNPTDAFGTLDTSGTAGAAHGAVEAVTPIFEVAKAQDAVVAAKALDPNDSSVDASMVVLPEGMVIKEAGVQDAIDRVKGTGEKAASEPVEVGGLNPFQRQAAEETGRSGQSTAEAQQENEGAGSSSPGVDVGRQQGAKTGESSTEPAAAAGAGGEAKGGESGSDASQKAGEGPQGSVPGVSKAGGKK